MEQVVEVDENSEASCSSSEEEETSEEEQGSYFDLVVLQNMDAHTIGALPERERLRARAYCLDNLNSYEEQPFRSLHHGHFSRNGNENLVSSQNSPRTPSPSSSSDISDIPGPGNLDPAAEHNPEIPGQDRTNPSAQPTNSQQTTGTATTTSLSTTTTPNPRPGAGRGPRLPFWLHRLVLVILGVLLPLAALQTLPLYFFTWELMVWKGFKGLKKKIGAPYLLLTFMVNLGLSEEQILSSRKLIINMALLWTDFWIFILVASLSQILFCGGKEYYCRGLMYYWM